MSEISVVIPVYNEEREIKNSVASIKQVMENISSPYEIILVNDGSTDGTIKTLSSIQDPSVKVVGYEENMGKGFALRYGIRQAKGNIVVCIDADLEHDPHQIPRYIKLLDHADCVIASRYHPKSQWSAHPLRRLMHRLFCIVVGMMIKLRCNDTQCGLKVFKAQVVNSVLTQLVANRFAFDVELLCVISLCGFKIIEAPVVAHTRPWSFNPLSALRMLMDVVLLSYRLSISRSYSCKKVN